MMDFPQSTELIAVNMPHNWKSMDEVLPYKQSQSGARDDNKSGFNDNVPENTNPVLILDDDIINAQGYGLKRGFYELSVDSDYTFISFVQSGKTKAKIPVLKYEQISGYGTDFEWADKKRRSKDMPNSSSVALSQDELVTSKGVHEPILTEKEKKKRKKKYQKGLDPIAYIHKSATIRYDRETESYIVIWEKYNIKVTGIIKVQ